MSTHVRSSIYWYQIFALDSTWNPKTFFVIYKSQANIVSDIPLKVIALTFLSSNVIYTP